MGLIKETRNVDLSTKSEPWTEQELSKLKKLKRKSTRKGWAKVFKRMAKNGDDKLLMPNVFEDEKFEEWT